jgi:CRP-like cAMP-binding protein
MYGTVHSVEEINYTPDMADKPARAARSASSSRASGGKRAAPAAAPSPRRNHLLAALPDSDYERLVPHLEPIPMGLGEVLYESGSQLRYVYFPTTCIVSLLYVMEDGASAEIAIVGNEGILGISLFMGGDTTPSRAVVQSAGHGVRLRPRCSRANSSASVRRCICCCAIPRR